MTDQEALDLFKGEFDLDIPNFKKWNPDTRGRRAWFALSVDWYDDPRVHQLSANDERLWLRLLTLRARSSVAIKGLSLRYLRARVPLPGGSLLASILKLLKLGLIDVRSSALHNRHNITDRQTGHVGIAIHPKLEGIDDVCFAKIALPAQEAWVKKYGVEAVKEIVPVAHSAWVSENPVQRNGQRTPLALYLDRCLQNHLKFAGSTNFEDPEVFQKHIASVLKGARGD